jgi:hypothetical protein
VKNIMTTNDYDFLQPKVFLPARKVLLDSVLGAIGYYYKNYSFQLRELCENKLRKENKIYDIEQYSTLRHAYEKLVKKKKDREALSENQKIEMLAFEKYNKQFLRTLEIVGFKRRDTEANSQLVRMKLCPAQSESRGLHYVEDEDGDYAKAVEEAKLEINKKSRK